MEDFAIYDYILCMDDYNLRLVSLNDLSAGKGGGLGFGCLIFHRFTNNYLKLFCFLFFS